MNFDQLGQAWQDENAAASPEVPLDKQLKTTRAVERFFGSIFRRDLIESAACLYVIYKFGAMLFDKGFVASVTLPSVFVFGVVVNVLGAIHVIYRLYRARTRTPRPGVDAPMRDYVGAELARVEEQIQLLRTVHVWYLGPFYVGVNAMFLSYDGFCAEFVGAVVIVTALYAFIYAFNQLAVSTSMRALRDELRWTRDQLDGKESEPPEPLDQGQVTKQTLRFVFRWFAILLSVGIGVFLSLSWVDLHRARNPEYPKRSPFDAVRWQDNLPEVRLGEDWYRLDSIDDASADEIIDFCLWNHGREAQKRFEEDLVEVLSEMGQPPGETVRLVVTPIGSDEPQTFQSVPMSEEKRWAIKRAAIEREKARNRE